MSQVTMTAGAATASSPTASPSARQVRQPRWRDGRTVAGVLLLLTSLTVGAKVVAAARGTIGVLAVTADLPAGHVLAAADLEVREVKLPAGSSTAGLYLAADQRGPVDGRILGRAVVAGELLPGSAVLVTPPEAAPQIVPLSVGDARHPVLQSGDVVDVFATFATAGDAGGCVTVTVGTALEVVGDVAAGQGSGSAAVMVRAPAAVVPVLVHAAATSTLMITKHLGEGTSLASGKTQDIAGLVPTGQCGARG